MVRELSDKAYQLWLDDQEWLAEQRHLNNPFLEKGFAFRRSTLPPNFHFPRYNMVLDRLVGACRQTACRFDINEIVAHLNLFLRGNSEAPHAYAITESFLAKKGTELLAMLISEDLDNQRWLGKIASTF